MGKRCGNCQNFTRLKNDMHSTGLCDPEDSRVGVDSGRRCKNFKPKKYKRKKMPEALNNYYENPEGIK